MAFGSPANCVFHTISSDYPNRQESGLCGTQVSPTEGSVLDAASQEPPLGCLASFAPSHVPLGSRQVLGAQEAGNTSDSSIRGQGKQEAWPTPCLPHPP